MTINANNLIIQVNSLLANNSLSNTELDNTIIAGKILESKQVNEKTFTQLASTSSAESGKLAFNTQNCKYYYSDGTYWNSDFNLNKQVFTALAWGLGVCGRLGDNTVTNKSSPSLVDYYDWCDVSAGDFHTSAIRTDGTLWSWGWNLCGRLGNNSTVNCSSPVSVVGGFIDWCQVSTGWQNSAAVRQNGTLWAWGCGCAGSLGNGTTTDKSSPVSVVGGFTDWCQVSVGCDHMAAVRNNGTLWAWGSGALGRLGDGTTVGKCSPVSVVGVTGWCQVSVSGAHSLGVTTSGLLYAWGNATCGRLGDGTTVNKSSPVAVAPPVGFTWIKVSAGCCHSAAILNNATIWSWGFGTNGRLGDGTTTNKSSPVSVVGGFTSWCQVSAGRYNTAALRTNATLWAWGDNSLGQLGDGTIVNKSSPVSVTGNITTWCQVSAGNNHTVAIYVNSVCPYPYTP